MRQAHLLLSLLVIFLASAQAPERSDYFPGLDENAMRQRLESTDIQPMEGIWYYPAEKVTIGIERMPQATAHDQDYRLIMLSSEDLELLPGTVMGYMRATAQDNKYLLWLYCERDHTTLLHPLECVATVDSQHATLTFDPPHWDVKIKVNFARFLPTLFRGISITPSIEREKAPIGFKKIYPEGEGNKFNHVRYL